MENVQAPGGPFEILQAPRPARLKFSKTGLLFGSSKGAGPFEIPKRARVGFKTGLLFE